LDLPSALNDRWPKILDMFELYFAANEGHLMWMVDFIRAVLTCRGVEQLYPESSLHSLLVSRWPEGFQLGSPFVSVRVDKQGTFRLTLQTREGGEQVLERRRLASAVKALRVLVRQLGVRLGPPHDERPPAGFIRRAWVFFPEGRVLIPPG
jgi:hypothetical protein